MSYFPYSKMPLTIKQTPAGAESSIDLLRITAKQYNTHDEEIGAIEEFLGTFDKTGKIRTGIIGNISNIVDQINSICVGGVCSSSGAVQSGQLMTFPEDATVTYLDGSLDHNDSVVNVASTSGFPQKGILSILNDVVQGTPNGSSWKSTVAGGTSTVEWIRYNGKTSTSFLNCQRGYLGTVSGTHTGAIENFDRTKDGDLNIQDQCMSFQAFPYEVCQFRNQGIRNAYQYSCPLLDLIGSIEYIEDYVRLQPSAIKVDAGSEASAIFVGTSNKLNILGTRSDNSLFLLSADANYSDKEQLSPYEAYTWTQLAYTNGLIKLNKNPSDFICKDGAIPVFSGKLGVQFSIGALNGAQSGDGEGPFDFNAACASMGADGTLYSYTNDKRNGPQGQSFYSVLYYETMLIPNVRTKDERNN